MRGDQYTVLDHWGLYQKIIILVLTAIVPNLNWIGIIMAAHALQFNLFYLGWNRFALSLAWSTSKGAASK